jgi:hypothetical protein
MANAKIRVLMPLARTHSGGSSPIARRRTANALTSGLWVKHTFLSVVESRRSERRATSRATSGIASAEIRTFS